MAANSNPVLIGMGNPLLDISAEVDDEFLQKYQLQSNNAILASDSHMNIYDEMINKYPIHYVAGGAAQSSIRGAQWLLPKGSTAFIGCVGKDEFAKILRSVTESDGVKVLYMETDETSTGKCAVLITQKGTQRSLIAHLAAAEKYRPQHLDSLWPVIEEAQYFYVEGYFLTVSMDAILRLAEYALESDKAFGFNLSAPFLCQLFTTQLDQVLPYCDYVFGNEAEALAYATAHGWTMTAISEIAEELSKVTKHNTFRPRIVVITQGQEDVLVARYDPQTGQTSLKDFPIYPIDPSQIVDTNGAGDAFVGGFLSQLVQNRPLQTCIKAAVWTAHKVIQVNGAVYPKDVARPEDFGLLKIKDI